MSRKQYYSIMVLASLTYLMGTALLNQTCLADETIKGHYCYTYGDNESVKEAREMTKNLALRNAIESYMVFIESESSVENFVLTDDTMRVMTSGYLRNIRVISHTEKGRTICETIECSISPDELRSFISEQMKSALSHQENVYRFTTDLLDCARLLLDGRYARTNGMQEVREKQYATLEKGSYSMLRPMYEERELLLEAQTGMEKWKNSKNQAIKKMAIGFIESTDTCLQANNLRIQGTKEALAKPLIDVSKAVEEAAIAGAKERRCGHQLISILGDSLTLHLPSSHDPSILPLSKDETERIIEKVNRMFSKELQAYNEKGITWPEALIGIYVKQTMESNLQFFQ